MSAARAGALWAALTLLPAAPALADEPISEAEQRLFADAHLRNTASPGLLRYRYARAGSLEPALADEVSLRLEPSAQPDARKVHVEYLSDARALRLPDLEAATSNPLILFFLERDVREMQRLTGGQAAYFRKRVRLALAETAQVRPVTIEHDGRSYDGWEISVRPFDQDPLKPRFERYADKRYAFTLCDRIPGAVYELRTVMTDRRPPGADGAARPALVDESVRFEMAKP
jgi:hypothetical protein